MFLNFTAMKKPVQVERLESDHAEREEGVGSVSEDTDRSTSSPTALSGPSSEVRLRLKDAMQRAVAELPESPHKTSNEYGDQFQIFLRFKGRTKLATWTPFSTMIDLQKLFFEVFHFPEKVLHVFLLNKVKLLVVPKGAEKENVNPGEFELLSMLGQLYPGIIVEAHSDVWEAWYKHAVGGGKLVRRLSLGNSDHENPKTMSARVERILNEPDTSQAAFYCSVLVNSLIFLSSVIFCVETLPYVHSDQGIRRSLKTIETMCVSAFTIELVSRFAVAQNQTKFISNKMNVIDFIAILPFYFDLFMSEAPIPGLSILRLLRLARVLRLFKVMKTFISVLSGTVSNSSTPLVMLTFFLSITTIIFSSILYYAERGTYDDDLGVWRRRIGYICPYICLQKESYLGCDYKGQVVDIFTAISVGKLKDDCVAVFEQSPFDSIVATFWVICQTMTVVGYGDTEILSPLGKFIGTCSVLTGILALALPISIIETNFSREMASFRKRSLFQQMQKKIKKELNPRSYSIFQKNEIKIESFV